MNIAIKTKTGPETIESPDLFSSVLLIFVTRSRDSPAQLTFHYNQSTQLVHFIKPRPLSPANTKEGKKK